MPSAKRERPARESGRPSRRPSIEFGGVRFAPGQSVAETDPAAQLTPAVDWI